MKLLFSCIVILFAVACGGGAFNGSNYTQETDAGTCETKIILGTWELDHAKDKCTKWSAYNYLASDAKLHTIYICEAFVERDPK